jgi:hypothetical protein
MCLAVQAVRHKELVVVVEGVRRRLASTPSPDPLLLINFPDLDNQFKAGPQSCHSTLIRTSPSDEK